MSIRMKRLNALLGVLMVSATVASANERDVLHYDSPASEKKVVNKGKGKAAENEIPLWTGKHAKK